MAQRLVRTICPVCKVEQKSSGVILKKIGFPENEIDTTRFMRGTGCESVASLATRAGWRFTNCSC
jgi:type II secretory ATPase GspE/PulE/Tfp pilus assembly ATPase PilB-like protein